MQRLTCTPEGSHRRIAVVVSRFNTEVTDDLLAGCLAALSECGVSEAHMEVVDAPGAFELPLICDRLAATGRFQGIVALGAVIRGATAHFDFIAGECARGLSETALRHGIPVGFGVLTTENPEQAAERADPARRNKGREAALAVLETAAVLDRLDAPS